MYVYYEMIKTFFIKCILNFNQWEIPIHNFVKFKINLIVIRYQLEVYYIIISGEFPPFEKNLIGEQNIKHNTLNKMNH